MSRPILMACCLALLAAGCGGSNSPRTPDQVTEDNLAQVGELYRNYQFTKKKPPEKFADLNTVRTTGMNGYEAVRTGKVILRYGATLPDLAEEPGPAGADEVLAYEKAVPESGGSVLMLNRSVQKMTAEEFKAAKLAGKEAPASAPTKGKAK
jgi:hypothetical protein